MAVYDTDPPAVAIAAGLISPNETGSNGEPANVTDGLFAIARAIDRLAQAIRTGPQSREAALRREAETLDAWDKGLQ